MVGKEGITPEISFEIPKVSEPLYMQTCEDLAKEGYTFIVDILRIPIFRLTTRKETKDRFEFINISKNMSIVFPPSMEVVINPKNLRIKNSNFKSTADQIRMIEKEEAALKVKLPQRIRDFISMRMESMSVLVQIDDKHQKETGRVLFTDWYGRTNEQISPGVFADIGRDGGDPAYGHQGIVISGSVSGSRNHGDGGGNVFAVPVVRLPRKIAV